MAMARLFSRSRQALMPSLPILKCNTYASLVLSSKEPKARKMAFPKVIDEELWNIWRKVSERSAHRFRSPFLLLKDYISTDNACSNSEGEKLIKHLSDCKDIKYSTEVRSILMDRRLGEFKRSMTIDEIENYVMRHLYILTLQEVIPFEKQYMEHLINEENLVELNQGEGLIFLSVSRSHSSASRLKLLMMMLKDEVYTRWRHDTYHLVVRDHSKIFLMLPGPCLRRGFELHISRIPYKYCFKNRLPKVFKNDLLGKLEEDYEILTTKIHELSSTISKPMMRLEVAALVDHVPGAPSFGDRYASCFNRLADEKWV